MDGAIYQRTYNLDHRRSSIGDRPAIGHRLLTNRESHRALKYVPSAIIALFGSGSLIYQWYWTRPLWVDEEMIALNFRDRSWAGLAGPLWLNQAAPLGWLILQRTMLLAFGAGERTLRALPVLFGIATIWAAVWAGRRLLQPVGAAIFTLLCSFGLYISFFPLETKHYSGDTFFGLLLPALAVWTLQPVERDGDVRQKRILAWWLIASAAQWLANGALFSTPACAAVIGIVIFQRAGFRTALLSLAPGVVFLASFAAHYWLLMRYTLHSEYLQQYWWHAFPPRHEGVLHILSWLASRIPMLASNPGGASIWLMWPAFWIAAVTGAAIALRRHFSLGAVLIAVPVSAFVFAGLHLVPLEERLSLWALPSLYLAIAVAAEQLRAHVTVVAALVALLVTGDIVRTGVHDVGVRPRSNHSLDDRAGVGFLLSQRQPGDVLVTMRMGLPAVWWYAGVNVAAPNLGRAYEQDGASILELQHRWPGPDCRAGNLTAALDGKPRVAIYLGFDSRFTPGFQELVLDTLSTRGRMIAYRTIAEEGIAAVFDLRQPPRPWSVVLTRPGGTALRDVPRAAGCVGFFPATRW